MSELKSAKAFTAAAVAAVAPVIDPVTLAREALLAATKILSDAEATLSDAASGRSSIALEDDAALQTQLSREQLARARVEVACQRKSAAEAVLADAEAAAGQARKRAFSRRSDGTAFRSGCGPQQGMARDGSDDRSAS